MVMLHNVLKNYAVVDIYQVISGLSKKKPNKTPTIFQTKPEKTEEKNAILNTGPFSHIPVFNFAKTNCPAFMENRHFPGIIEFSSQFGPNLTFGLFWFLNVFNRNFLKNVKKLFCLNKTNDQRRTK